MSRGFYVEGLIFGILWCVATDIKMLRSKFLAKKVSAKFAYQNRSCLPYITPQYLHICDIFTMSKFVQIHFLYSRKVQMPLSWKPMFCLYTSCSNIFKELLKSCFGSCKFAPILFAYLTGFSASFDHKSTSELEKRFSLTSFYISWPPFWKLSSRQWRWPATENSIAQKGLLNYLAFCFACFTKTLISQAFKQLSWYCGALRPPLVSGQFSKML